MRIPINGFGGLVSRIGDAPVGSMQSGKNFGRTDERGWLAPGLKYYRKFEDTGDNGLPQLTASGGDNYLDPDIYGYDEPTDITWVDVHNFTVAEHGGQNITVAVGTYKKNGFDDPVTSKTRFGIWVRPYWSGAAWVDEWRELTEMFIFEIVELPGGGDIDKIVVGNGATNDFTVIDPTGKVFNNSYFGIGGDAPWTIAYGDFADDENFDRVISCGFISTNKYFLGIQHDNTDYASRGVGTILWVYRNFLYKDLPTSLTSFIFSLFNEIRMTSGNGVNDVSLTAGFRSKTWIPGHTLDSLIIDAAALDIWQYAIVVSGIIHAGSSDPPAAGTKYYKYSIVMDDDNETALYDVMTWNGGGPHVLTAGNSFTTDSTNDVQIEVFADTGTMPRRAKKVNVFVSDDNVAYNLIKSYELTALISPSGTSLTTIAGMLHNYDEIRFAGYLLNADYTNIGGSAESVLGRTVTDTGVVRWKAGTVVGRRGYVGNVYVGGVTKANQIMASKGAGSGAMQYDVFANVGTDIIDVEYSDGDEIVALAPLAEVVLVLKRRSIVLVAPDGRGGFARKSISQNVGCSSAKSVVVFNEVAYWVDENGRHSYSIHAGLETLDLISNDDWLALTTAQKEAAASVIDRTNLFWIVSAGGLQWVYDIVYEKIEGRLVPVKGGGGEWMPYTFLDVPVAMKRDIPGTMDFIKATGKLLTINKVSVNAWGFDGADYTMEWRANALRVLRGEKNRGNANSLLLKGIAVEYASDVAITLTVYADGSLVRTETLPTTKTKMTVFVPNGTICKECDFKFAATTDGEDATLSIKSADVYADLRRGT